MWRESQPPGGQGVACNSQLFQEGKWGIHCDSSHTCFRMGSGVFTVILLTVVSGGEVRYTLCFFSQLLQVGKWGVHRDSSHNCFRWGSEVYIVSSHSCFRWGSGVFTVILLTLVSGGEVRYTLCFFSQLFQVGKWGVHCDSSHNCFRWGNEVYIVFLLTVVSGGEVWG